MDVTKLASTNTVSQTTDTVSREVEIFYNEILNTKTFDGLVKIIPARDRFAMSTGVTSNMIQAYATSPTPTGTVSVTDEEFTIEKKSIFHNFEYDALKNTRWNEAIMNLDDQGLPADLEEFILMHVAKSAKAQLENELWNGNGGLADDPTTTYDGWGELIANKLLAAGLGARVIALGSDPTVAANIEGLLATMTAQVPKALIADKENVRIMMSPVVEQALHLAYQANAYSNIPTDNSLVYGRFRIEVIDGLNDNRIIIGKPSNLGLGLATDSDIVNLSVVDKYAQGDGNFARIFGNLGYGAGVATTDWVIGQYPTT